MRQYRKTVANNMYVIRNLFSFHTYDSEYFIERKLKPLLYGIRGNYATDLIDLFA
jgi:hypothetical protein